MGLIIVPEDSSTDTNPGKNETTSTMACNRTHINVPWVTPIPYDSPLGLLLKSIYTNAIERKGNKFLAAMPSGYNQRDILIIDSDQESPKENTQ